MGNQVPPREGMRARFGAHAPLLALWAAFSSLLSRFFWRSGIHAPHLLILAQLPLSSVGSSHIRKSNHWAPSSPFTPPGHQVCDTFPQELRSIYTTGRFGRDSHQQICGVPKLPVLHNSTRLTLLIMREAYAGADNLNHRKSPSDIIGRIHQYEVIIKPYHLTLRVSANFSSMF